eukprot:g21797.t1
MASPDVDLQRLSREEVLALPLAPQVLSGSCSICLEDLDSPDLEARLLPCQHAFHTDCAALWLSKTAVCPNCRASVREEADTGLALDPPRRVEAPPANLFPGNSLPKFTTLRKHLAHSAAALDETGTRCLTKPSPKRGGACKRAGPGLGRGGHGHGRPGPGL